MRRIDRVRLERRRRLIVNYGLAFTIGALASQFLAWRLDQQSLSPPGEPRVAEATEYVAGAPVETVVPAPPAATSPVATSGSDDGAADVVRRLKMRRLELPVEVARDRLRDSFDERRGGGIRRHDAIDIMAPKGTPVRAVEDAHVAKLFKSIAGGLTVYLFDEAETFAYYYAHLDRYAAGLRDGQDVRRGDVIGYVGSTGNASEDAPHLHFAILQLGPERRWWQGEPINPYLVLR